jgi:hypothetical protein
MGLASNRNLLSLFGFLALSSVLVGCPDKDAPAETTTAEPERAEPDDEGKVDTKKPAAPAAAPADAKKPEDDDKGGW